MRSLMAHNSQAFQTSASSSGVRSTFVEGPKSPSSPGYLVLCMLDVRCRAEVAVVAWVLVYLVIFGSGILILLVFTVCYHWHCYFLASSAQTLTSAIWTISNTNIFPTPPGVTIAPSSPPLRSPIVRFSQIDVSKRTGS